MGPIILVTIVVFFVSSGLGVGFGYIEYRRLEKTRR